MGRKLTRSRNKVISGVAGGIAEYFDIDPTIIRLGFVIMCFMGFLGIFVYLIGLIVMPKGESYVPKNFFENDEPEFMGVNDKDRDFSHVIGDSLDQKTPSVSNSKIVVGAGLIFLGVFFLIKNSMIMQYFFPAMLILVGGLIIFRRRK